MTIRNIKCIPLGEHVFSVHGLQFDSQVEFISVLSHANLAENIKILSIKKTHYPEKPNNSLLFVAYRKIQGDETCLYPLQIIISPSGKSGERVSRLANVCLPHSIFFL